jgi:hypothetical protein
VPRALRARFFGVLALAAIAAGCGGSSYTKSDFVARADAICTSTLRQARALAPPASTSGAALSDYLGKLVPLVDSEANQLRALKRPADTAHDGATLTAYFAALGHVVAAYRQLRAAAARGDDQTVTDVEAALNANPVDSLAASYGLKTCGTPGSTSV